MTVSRTDSEQAFTASSGTASYSVAFPVRAADDLVVTLDGEALTGGGSDYSVTLLGSPAGSSGATITPVSPWASGTLRVRRETTRLQEVDFQTAQRFDPEVVEQALDHGVMRAQEIDAKQARTIRGAVGEVLAELPPAADRANKTLVFDASGNPGAGVALSSELTITGTPGATKIIHSVDGDNAQYGVGLPDGDYGDFTFSSGVATLDAGVVDLNAIASAVKSGLDADLVTGTAGAAGDLAAWNADGDLVAATAASQVEMEAGTEAALRAMSPLRVGQAITALAGWTYLSSQASTSGTAVDFTIPAGAREIEIGLSGVSVTGTDGLLVQIGDAGGIEATNYIGAAFNSSADYVTTTGFFMHVGGASRSFTGAMRLTAQGADRLTWSAQYAGLIVTASAGLAGGGLKTLSAALTTVRVAPSGSDSFDAGTIYCAWRI